MKFATIRVVDRVTMFDVSTIIVYSQRELDQEIKMLQDANLLYSISYH